MRYLLEKLGRLDEIPPDPVLVIEEYEQDTVFHIRNLYGKVKKDGLNPKAKRGKISAFTWQSRRRAKIVLRNVASKMCYEFGLTYPLDFPVNGDEVKKHLRAVQQFFRRRGIRFYWCLEFQERGAPHFHGLIDKPLSKEDLAKVWYKIVGSGDENHLEYGCHCAPIRVKRAIANYLTTYLNKLEQKIVPDEYTNVGRFWGYSMSLLERSVSTIKGDYYSLQRILRTTKRWYTAECRSWGFRWQYKGRGFVAWGHAKLKRFMEEIYAKKLLDNGVSVCIIG